MRRSKKSRMENLVKKCKHKHWTNWSKQEEKVVEVAVEYVFGVEKKTL